MSTTSKKTPVATAPVLKVTRYETVSSTMMVIVIGLLVTVFFLIVLWLSNRRPHRAEEPLVLWTSNPGGFPEGTEGQTLGGNEGPPADISDLESSPEIENDKDAKDMIPDEPDVMDTIDSVTSLSEVGAQQMPQLLSERRYNVGERNRGVKKIMKGTGRKGLGDGPGVGGYGREQRWFVRFSDGGTIEEYAKQLDFFKIELAAILPEGVLVYLSNMSQPQPTKRTVKATDQEKRLYFTWKTATRRKLDEQIFQQKAGVDVSRAIILQFYSPETEQVLGKLEHDYRNREPKDIVRTYFSVRPNGAGGYEFYVTSQVTVK